MPRAPRISAGGVVYHVLNRANGRATIFSQKQRIELRGLKVDYGLEHVFEGVQK